MQSLENRINGIYRDLTVDERFKLLVNLEKQSISRIFKGESFSDIKKDIEKETLLIRDSTPESQAVEYNKRISECQERDKKLRNFVETLTILFYEQKILEFERQILETNLKYALLLAKNTPQKEIKSSRELFIKVLNETGIAFKKIDKGEKEMFEEAKKIIKKFDEKLLLALEIKGKRSEKINNVFEVYFKKTYPDLYGEIH